MRLREYISTLKNTGKSKDAPVKSEKSYVIYDSCYKCPLYVYIDLVCNDNLRALVMEGDPDDDILKEAKMNLITEFAELSGNEQTSSLNNIQREYYRHKSQLYIYRICREAILLGKFDAVQSTLKDYGMKKCSFTTEQELVSTLKQIDAKMKHKIIQIKQAVSRYNSLMEKNSKSKGVTPDTFHEQLTAFSIEFKFEINDAISVAKFAQYLKSYNKKVTQYGFKHK